MAQALPISVVIGAKDKATAVVQSASRSIRGQLGKLKESMDKVNLAAVGLSGAGIALAFERITRPAFALEDSLAAVRSVAAGTFGSVEADMRRVETAARDWSKEHTDAATAFAKSSYQMISAGLDTEQAIEGTRTALAVAKATMGDAVSTTASLATVYNTLGNKAAPVGDEMKRIGDILVRTQQYFQLSSMDQLTEGLNYGIPIAIQYKMKLADLSAIIGQLNGMGLKGGHAGTAFAASMAKMNEAAKKLHFQVARNKDGGVDFLKTIENLRKKFAGKLDLPKTQMAMQDAFGTDGLRAIMLFLGKTDDLRKGIDEVTNSTGAMEKAQVTMEATTSAKWQIMSNRVADLSTTLTQQLQPAILSAGTLMSGFIDGIREHWDLLVFGIKTFVGVWLVTTMPVLVGKATAAIMANPQFVAFVAAMTAIIAGINAMEEYQKKQLRDRMKATGVDRVFEGPSGMAALDKWRDEQEKKSRNKANFRPWAPEFFGKDGPPVPMAGTPSITEVGGEMRIVFEGAPKNMLVDSVKATNPKVPVRAEVGHSRLATEAP